MKQKLSTILTIAGITAVFLILFGVMFSMFGNTMRGITDSLAGLVNNGQSSGRLALDPDAQKITNSYYFGGGSADSIAIPGYERLVLKAGQKQQDVLLFNPENNTCFFVFEILTEDGKLLYKSGLVEPGKALYKIELSEPLKAGSYPATLRYSCYAEGTLAQLNGADVNITLEVS